MSKKVETGFNVPTNEIYLWQKYARKIHKTDGGLINEDYTEFKCVCGQIHKLDDSGTKKTIVCEELDIKVTARTVPKLMEKWAYAQIDVIKESKVYKRDMWLDDHFSMFKKPWIWLFTFFDLGGIYDALLAIMFLITYPVLIGLKTFNLSIWLPLKKLRAKYGNKES